MIWSDIRNAYPNEWLIVEALEAHTTRENKRLLDRLAVIERCSDGKEALNRYRSLHQKHPLREFYFVHTAKEELEILEHQWLGIRSSHAVHSKAGALIDLRELSIAFSTE